jgi:hypothetical protein
MNYGFQKLGKGRPLPGCDRWRWNVWGAGSGFFPSWCFFVYTEAFCLLLGACHLSQLQRLQYSLSQGPMMKRDWDPGIPACSHHMSVTRTTPFRRVPKFFKESTYLSSWLKTFIHVNYSRCPLSLGNVGQDPRKSLQPQIVLNAMLAMIFPILLTYNNV